MMYPTTTPTQPLEIAATPHVEMEEIAATPNVEMEGKSPQQSQRPRHQLK